MRIVGKKVSLPATSKQQRRLKKLFEQHGVSKDVVGLDKSQVAQLINIHQKWHKLTNEEKAKYSQ